ncbi:MAG: hypothetical protein WAK01_08330 [Methylocystis sp.]
MSSRRRQGRRPFATKHPKQLGVQDAVAERDWNAPAPKGVYRGIASYNIAFV